MTSSLRENLLLSIRETALDCGRDPGEIQLVAVTKGHFWEEIEDLYNAGQRVFGENKVQELLSKIQTAPRDCAWHFIGTLQQNKVRKIIGLCPCIHSVDSIALAEKIHQVSVDVGVNTSILLQVNVSGESSKQGFTPAACREAIRNLKRLSGITISGFMTMAPFTENTEEIRGCFRGLRLLRDEIQPQFSQQLHLSMGMSHDYKIAIQEGATLLRIGSLLFSK